jgi:sugar (pentulose or hexulose) kinase
MFANSRRQLDGIAIDSWGLDFGLLDKNGRLLGNPRCYRDPRSQRGFELLGKRFDMQELHQRTGASVLVGSTFCQLYEMVCATDPELEYAETLLMIPDLLSYFLCGEKASEYSNVTTTQLYSPSLKGWDFELLERSGIPKHIFTKIQQAGRKRGHLTEKVAAETGLSGTAVLAVGSHDTASALASVPCISDNFAFASSGTWSLMGVVTLNPVINDFTFSSGFSVEGTADGSFRMMKNMMGLWLAQECKQEWEYNGEACGWDELAGAAEVAAPLRSFVNPDNPCFFGAGNMARRIQEYCKATAQSIPETKGEIIRCLLESLAMRYRQVVQELDIISGKPISTLHIVGGGTQNRLLNQFVANATGRTVVTGPSEGSAIGNLMTQVLALGEVKNHSEMTQVVLNSFPTQVYEPKQARAWDAAYELFNRMP